MRSGRIIKWVESENYGSHTTLNQKLPSFILHNISHWQGVFRKILLLLTNARPTLRRTQFIPLFTLSPYFGFIPMAETWLNNYIKENTITVPGCKSSRKGRQTKRGGGCLVYVPERISATLCQHTKLNTIQDATWVRSELSGESLLVGSVYHKRGSCQKNLMTAELTNTASDLPGPEETAGYFSASHPYFPFRVTCCIYLKAFIMAIGNHTEPQCT